MSPRPPHTSVPRIWDGGTCFIVGGGPSLRGFDAERLRGRQVLAVNWSTDLCPWADALYFADNAFLERNGAVIEAWPGVAITGSRRAAASLPCLRWPEHRPGGAFSTEPHWTWCGVTSGHTAVNVAGLLGARTIVLLGFDGRIGPDGSGNFHDHAAAPIHAWMYDTHYRPGWRGVAKLAAAAGLEVLNATPGSAITEFPMADIDDILREGAPA